MPVLSLHRKEKPPVVVRALLFGGLCVLTGLRGAETIERPDVS